MTLDPNSAEIPPKKKQKSNIPINLKYKDLYYVRIEGTLPMCLYLTDQILPMHLKGRAAEIKIKRIENLKHPMRKMIHVPNNGDIKTIHVRENPFSRTKFILFYKATIAELKRFNDQENWVVDPYTERSMDPLFIKGLEFINHFIQQYRFFSDEPALSTITPWELETFLLAVYIGPPRDLNQKRIFHSKHISAKGITAISPGKKFDGSKFINELKKSLDVGSEVEIWNEILLASRSLYLKSSYRQSVVESLSALEIFLVYFIRKKLITKKIEIEKINKQLKRANTVLLMNKLMEEAVGQKFKRISRKLWKKFEKARKVRNKVVHQGLVPNRDDTNNTIITCREIIAYLIANFPF